MYYSKCWITRYISLLIFSRECSLGRIENVRTNIHIYSLAHDVSRIKTDHGSFSQEKALVTGFQAANATLSYFGRGKETLRQIIPVEADEPHIALGRRIYQAVDRFDEVFNPLSDFFMT